MKQSIKKKLLKTDLGTLLFYKIRVLREKLSLAQKSDYQYIKIDYKKRYGKEIDLKNPKTISEKLQWLKLFYRNENMPICSDKYDVKIFLEKFGYEHLLNEVLGVYHTADEIDNIDLESLPDSFVVKATHGSGWNFICKDKTKVDWVDQKKIFKQWMKLNLYVFGREWNYKNLKPKILIEKFIDEHPLNDYKFICYNGKPKTIQVNSVKDNIKYMDFYDLDWNRLGIMYDSYVQADHFVPKPDQYNEMLQIAEELSQEFPYVRVDFYNYNGKILLGELTFFPVGGIKPIVPETDKYENLFGSYLTLPEPNHNMELYHKINA
ncbi:teichuronopeptide biosynthesis TupA-like protein [Winogradskyella epiphytica]|uniref:Teichuronopeptide biosynthesis TupA-like protein n=1 Tax=Winogradskyella epiphytica TaxID=262005 RepID=A0A2V4XVA3_9FLAO|nr:ATP-grasp fold amidoligase family protein [Winogradskyella epiphytica]PYE82707.1 teichuronopeptide biosynthesis TupA-like protein [Winogradskyella epiphytica]GGW53107.1 glycosyl transferase [Winogradskyella epiphytica]